jgi:hypothetical protein
MHVYLRWYENGKPKTGPLLMANESAARAAVLEKFPKATFSERKKTIYEPTAMLSGIEEVIFVLPGPPELKTIADILFPMDDGIRRTLPAFV